MEENKRKLAGIFYEPEADVLSWEINQKPITHAREMGNVIVHFASSGVPVLIEILEASRFLARTRKSEPQEGEKAALPGTTPATG